MDFSTDPGAAVITFHPINLTAARPVEHWAAHLALFTSALSLLGSVLIILTFLLFRDVRSTSREILAYLSLANVGASAACIWGVSEGFTHSEELGCQLQSVILIYCGIAEFLWTIALALYLYIIITREGSTFGQEGCPIPMLIVCWGVGFIITPLAYGLKKTGVDMQYWNTARWCLLRGHTDKLMGGSQQYVIWSMVVGDAWGMLAILCTFVLYVLTKRHIHRESLYHQTTLLTRGALSAAQQVDRKLTFIPLAYFLLHIWSIVRSLVALRHYESLTTADKILLGLQTFGDCSEGLVNAIIFLVFSPKVRQRIRSAVMANCYRCCIFCCGPPLPKKSTLQVASRGAYAQGSFRDRSCVQSNSTSRSVRQQGLAMGKSKETTPLLGDNSYTI